MIGADPELFLHDGKKFISAIGRIGGSKTQPLRLLGGFCLQEDNVAVEYNIPPCDSSELFAYSNLLMLEEINKRAEEQGLVTKIVSSANFSNDQLDHPMAQAFGCDPDYNAWELEVNPSPACPNPNLRSAGGHIHVQMESSPKKKVSMVRVLDLLIGTPLAFMDPESERRALYGKAGACRFKSYGVEYRTPSNVWLLNEQVMRVVASIILPLSKDKKLFDHWEKAANKNEDLIKTSINDLNEETYKELRPYLGQMWPIDLLPKPNNSSYVSIVQV